MALGGWHPQVGCEPSEGGLGHQDGAAYRERVVANLSDLTDHRLVTTTISQVLAPPQARQGQAGSSNHPPAPRLCPGGGCVWQSLRLCFPGHSCGSCVRVFPSCWHYQGPPLLMC